MRFVVYGAGAVGGTIAVRLARANHELAVIARGAHASAIRAHGLRLVTPDEDVTAAVPLAQHPGELELHGDEIVILAVKSQDTALALDALAGTAPPTIAVACAQNGIANEPEAQRRFARVIAVYVWMPALHLEPGVVELGCAPRSGYLDVGSYGDGAGGQATRLAAALTDAGFESIARADIMRWKARKLITNLGNAIDALCPRDAAAVELIRRARTEGERVLAAAGIAVLDPATEAARRDDARVQLRPVQGRARPGGSSWQSLARATGAIEAEYLNGEIVRLGRAHGIATPVNELLLRVATDHATHRRPPGGVPAERLLDQLPPDSALT